MKLKFKEQQFQEDATSSVVDVFDGQLNINSDNVGFSLNEIVSNADLNLSEDELLENLRDVQSISRIDPVDKIEKSSADQGLVLTVEMETGTGKTFTYVNTIYRLHQKYGWKKFVLIVPSVAIREGVYASLNAMKDYFLKKYEQTLSFFIFNSSRMEQIKDFARSNDLSLMIINHQSFNTGKEDLRKFTAPNEAFGDISKDSSPITYVQALHPIIIVDEPQTVLGAKKSNTVRENLKKFGPLFTVMYSATHRKGDALNKVYKLDSIDAYNKNIVKRIEVKGITFDGNVASEGFVQFNNIVISQDAPKAVVSFYQQQDSGLKVVTKTLSVRDDLFDLSGHLPVYKNNYIIDKIEGDVDDPTNHKIILLNGMSLKVGESVGKIGVDEIRRIQIRETIKSHLDKEELLFKKKIKVLSLFFIDKVSNYRLYGDEGINSGKYATMFEEEYLNLVKERLSSSFDMEYVNYLKNTISDPSSVHQGYFCQDKKGKFTDDIKSKKERDASESDAYDLIMKDKTRLLSFDEPVRFIFSHSALKEGWDNPNVFQICTLKDTEGTETRRRQEVGRGMRLCVNEDGVRQDADVLCASGVFDVNTLTVIANESYETFAKGLQEELAENLEDVPTVISLDLLKTLSYVDTTGNKIKLDDRAAMQCLNALLVNKYIDINGTPTDICKKDLQNNTFAIDELKDNMKLIDTLRQTLTKIVEGKPVYQIANANNARRAHFIQANFDKKEFQELWKRINSKTFYTVDFNEDELVNKAAYSLESNLVVNKIRVKIVKGITNEKIKDKNELLEGQSMSLVKNGKQSEEPLELKFNQKYDLLGSIATNTGLTRKVVFKILSKINPPTFNQFKINPDDFIHKASQIINDVKSISVVAGIQYHKLDNQVIDSSIFTENDIKGYLNVDAIASSKSIYDLVVFDSQTIEKTFANELESNKEVAVYTKLPSRGFYINTPMGRYNPDWAIVFTEGSVKHIYFVAETKGSTLDSSLRPVEQAKIECAAKHFAEISENQAGKVVYHKVKNYQQVLQIVTD